MEEKRKEEKKKVEKAMPEKRMQDKLKIEPISLFSELQFSSQKEQMRELLATSNFRVERITSSGQTSDWYDQEEDEFVVLLQGEAGIELEDGREVQLQAGDSLYLPAHYRHRVLQTGQNCVWLCFFVTVKQN